MFALIFWQSYPCNYSISCKLGQPTDVGYPSDEGGGRITLLGVYDTEEEASVALALVEKATSPEEALARLQ